MDLSTDLLKNVLSLYPGWEAAIADAESQALQCDERAARLRAVAEVFRKKKTEGEPWPGSEKASTHI